MLGVGREPLNGEATSMNSDSKEQDLIHEEFTYISGALTQILKCGPWEDLWNDKSAPRVLFLVIPGNPGLVGFYRTFIEALYFSLNQQYPVWVVSHGGHCKIPHEIKRKEEMVSNDTDDVFGLQGQAEHKLKFLRKFVPKDVKLILIGHSIGSYLALKIMKHSPEVEILRSILLFPTIERMAQSPQGKLLTPLLCHLRYILYIPIYLFTLLPERVKSFLVPFALNWQKLNDETVVTTLVDMLNMDCIANIMYLGSQEMRSVQERDSSTIKQHLNKVDFYSLHFPLDTRTVQHFRFHSKMGAANIASTCQFLNHPYLFLGLCDGCRGRISDCVKDTAALKSCKEVLYLSSQCSEAIFQNYFQPSCLSIFKSTPFHSALIPGFSNLIIICKILCTSSHLVIFYGELLQEYFRIKLTEYPNLTASKERK